MSRSLVRRASLLVGIALSAMSAAPASSLATNTPEGTVTFTVTPSHGVAGQKIVISGAGAGSLQNVGFAGSTTPSDAAPIPGQDAIRMTVPPQPGESSIATISSLEQALVGIFIYDTAETPAPTPTLLPTATAVPTPSPTATPMPIDLSVLPAVTTVWPKTVPSESGGLIVIRGKRFRGVNAVRVREDKVPFFAFGGLIIAWVPKTAIAGTTVVFVHTPRGWSAPSEGSRFDYTLPAETN